MSFIESTADGSFVINAPDPLLTMFHNDTNSNDTEDLMAECLYEPPPLTGVRVILVTFFGTLISFISMTENFFLFFFFLSRKYHRNTYNVYLILLAFFDFFVSFSYIFLMSVNVLSDYLQSPRLAELWISYMVPMITISHVGLTTSAFLIVAATIERYCITVNSRHLSKVQNNRKVIALIAVLFGVCSKGTMIFEFAINHRPHCAGLMTEYQLGFANFVYDSLYHIYFRFWYRNFITIFFPFAILTIFNVLIVKATSHHQKQSNAFLIGNHIEMSRRKRAARSATRTMLLVVLCYLISNVINVILTIWEHIDSEALLTEYDKIYAICLDLVSLLTNLSCACRLPIYMACQVPLRNEVLYTIRHWGLCRRAPHRSLCQDTASPHTPSSPENLCLVNGHATENGVNGTVPNGPPAYSLSINDPDTSKAYYATTSSKSQRGSFTDDQQSTTSSMKSKNEILKRIFRTTNKETLL